MLDRRARRALAGVLPGRVTEVVTFRQSTLGGSFIALAGRRRPLSVDPRHVGSPPEALHSHTMRGASDRRAGGDSQRLRASPGPGRNGPSCLNRGLSGTSSGLRRARTFAAPWASMKNPFPLSSWRRAWTGSSTSRSSAPVYRSYAWILPIEPNAVHPWDVTELEGRVRAARSELQASTIASAWELKAPLEELAAAREESSVSGRRLLLIGGEAAALLLAFAALAATRLRRDVSAARTRLTWFGARRWQLELETAAEIGRARACRRDDRMDCRPGPRCLRRPPGRVARERNPWQFGAFRRAVLRSASPWRPRPRRSCSESVRSGRARSGRAGLRPVDLLALGALAVVIVGVARGDAESGGAASAGGTGLFLLLLPGLVAFIAAVALVRVLEPGLRLGERLVRRRSVPARLAFLSLARNPGHAGVAAAFLVVSLGLALFAETYRSTLVRGQADQAAFAFPADYVVREMPTSPVRLTDVATPAALADLGTDPSPGRSAVRGTSPGSTRAAG